MDASQRTVNLTSAVFEAPFPPKLTPQFYFRMGRHHRPLWPASLAQNARWASTTATLKLFLQLNVSPGATPSPTARPYRKL